MSNNLVFQDWMLPLPMQQQSVLVLACRGPDGVGKFHPTKEIVCRYRASVLKAAYLGRSMLIDEGDDTTFMTLIRFSDDGHWSAITRKFFDNQDEIPHHYYMHLAHGAEIIGYKHPLPIMRERWLGFYHRCAENLHMTPETEAEMDSRLADWNRQLWDQSSASTLKSPVRP